MPRTKLAHALEHSLQFQVQHSGVQSIFSEELSEGIFGLRETVTHQNYARARSFDLLDTDPTHLSPQRLDQVTQLTETALEKHIQFGSSYGLLAHEFPNLPHAITWVNIDRLRPSPNDLDPQGMTAAHQRSTDRINAGLHALDPSPSTTP